MSLMLSRNGRKRFPFLSDCAHTGVSVGQRDRPRVVEPAHAAERAKGMVKGPVLLHQDDDVLGIEVGGSGLGLDCHWRTIESVNSPVAPIPENIAACLMKSRREVGMVAFLCVDWKGTGSIVYARVERACG